MAGGVEMTIFIPSPAVFNIHLITVITHNFYSAEPYLTLSCSLCTKIIKLIMCVDSYSSDF